MTHAGQPTLWVLIADGCRARVVVPSARDGEFHTLLRLGVAEHPHYPPALRQEPHRVDKSQFAADLAHRLNQEADHGSYDQLVIVAPGHVVHDVRESLSKPALTRLAGTEMRDLAKLSDHDLSVHIARWWLAPTEVAELGS
jgi:protein required for attachment to host cells